MDRRFLTVLAVSLLFALVVSGVFYQLSRGSGAKAASSEMKDLVIAAKPLSVGSTIGPDDVKLSKVPAATFPKGGFSKLEEVKDRPVISNVLLEEPLLEGRLAAKGDGFGLAPVIPSGMRAVSVRVTDVVGVAGFVQPGLRVDVLVTGRPPNGNATMTTTALQNIQVLSAGTTLAADQRGQAINAPSVTLLVTPEQAEILTLASNEGRIQLVLRNSKDDSVRATPGSDVLKLYGKGSAKPPVDRPVDDEVDRPRPRPRPVMAAPAVPFVPKLVPQEPDQVVVIRGATRTVENVLKSGGSAENKPEVKP